MGQTLTHGVYLPDEGERNCYAGLAANWQILDSSVGTIAANTAALAGKAPAVHTHTKADITDLLNSNFIPSANNSYDLGSSSYQWNNLYAKNYYYNGVAWGLDKANTWTANQKITNNPSYLYFKNTSMTMGTAPASNKYSGVVFQDSNNTELGNVTYKKHKNSNNVLVLNVKNTDGTNNYECSANLSLTPSGSVSFYSEGADCNLGQSTTPWKTLNGVNPGALSFPEGTTNNANTTFNPDITNWLTDGTGFIITAQVTGWLHIKIQNATGNFVWVKRASAGDNQTWCIVGDSNTNATIADIAINVPVVQSYTYTLKLKTSRIYAAIFMCLGNV